MTDTPPPSDSQPLQYNLLKLYRQHRDEIDTLTDPTTLFILDLTNHYGRVLLDELAGDLGLSPTALRKKIAPLLRGQMIAENDQAVTVTALGKRMLDHIDFLPPLAVSSDTPSAQFHRTRISQLNPVELVPAPNWLYGVITFLGIAAAVFFLILIVELVLVLQIPR